MVLEGPADHRGRCCTYSLLQKEMNLSKASPQHHIFTELHWADGEGGDKVTHKISSLFQIQSLMFGHYIFLLLPLLLFIKKMESILDC